MGGTVVVGLGPRYIILDSSLPPERRVLSRFPQGRTPPVELAPHTVPVDIEVAVVPVGVTDSPRRADSEKSVRWESQPRRAVTKSPHVLELWR